MADNLFLSGNRIPARDERQGKRGKVQKSRNILQGWQQESRMCLRLKYHWKCNKALRKECISAFLLKSGITIL
jgi:hypothetical protein